MEGNRMNTVISKGNKKLGGIPNISLPPVWSCVKGVPCSKGCYSLKAYRMYPNVKTAWNNNLAMAKTNRIKYFSDINDFLKNKKPAYFRWHVAGDILDVNYFRWMNDLAYMHPNTKFLSFTKNYKVVNEYVKNGNEIPENLVIYYSAWPGYVIDNPYDFPIAFMQDGNEIIPDSAFKCPGSCENCKHCFVTWQSIYFIKH